MKNIVKISGLKFGTSYYLRAYATNSAGTSYGSELKFTTKTPGVQFNTSLTYGTITDIDANNYKTIPIGIQVWMAENLKTSKLNDGTSILSVTDDAQWTNLLAPAYCWFDNNDTLYENIYGAYYNWFTVSTGKLCPVGWHVPSDDEWQLLVDYLGGNNIAGSKIKEAGTNNWVFSNNDATNSSGFTALPGGMRGTLDGTFSGQGNYGGWWSTTELNTSPLSAAWSRWIHGDTTVIVRSEIFKKDGFYVRCVKD
jgi:Fibrobacter succinogenes major domain (Fib_succ_major).